MTSDVKDSETGSVASLRQWLRLTAVYALIPLVLLVCGGDFGWWQAWLYAIVLVVTGAVSTEAPTAR